MVLAIPTFDPLNMVTPFTERDNVSYLQKLNGIKAKLNELIAHVAEADADLIVKLNQAIDDLVAQFNTDLDELRAELIVLVAEGGNTYDPTNGQLYVSASKSISNVYDNTRIYAWFASEYDAQEYTAAEYDALDMKARKFDLTATYPTLHDVNTL